jgi:hypothetical protein
MQIFDKKDIPIKGLYAAGIDTGGWSGDTYNFSLTGTGLAFAINSTPHCSGKCCRIYL